MDAKLTALQRINRHPGLLFLIIVAVCLLPWLPFTPQLGATARLPSYANLGAWFQGILTPAILLIAILSFRSQAEAAERQTAAQHEANRIANRTFFIANADRFVQHLAYRSLCAIVDGTPQDLTRGDAEMTGKVLNAMANLFRDFPADAFMPAIPEHTLHSLDEICRNKHYVILQQDIDDILAAGADANLLTLLDNRIGRIREGIQKRPPIPPPQQVSGSHAW